MKVLAWETATEHASVALWSDGEALERQLPADRGASEQILQTMQQLLADAGLGFRQLDLLAVGRGPGGFTGVRLAISIAQGLGYATALPIVPVSTLQAAAQDALQRDPTACANVQGRILVCQDARMGDVYCGSFVAGLDGVVAVAAERMLKPVSIQLSGVWADAGFVACGSAFSAFPSLAMSLGPALKLEVAGARPSASAVARLAVQAGVAAAVAPAQVQPLYLRNDVAVPSNPP